MLGEAALFAGRLSEASTALARAVKLHRTAPPALALGLIRSAETEIARGRRWQASRFLDRAATITPTTPLAAHLMVRGYAATIPAARTLDRATAALNEAERVLLSCPACQPCSIGFYVIAAR